ncbi:MAG TPA: ATP-grasp domain-containing protein [Candidatus Lokiarchaeia archaeon]|nr:ATP-grasp domain-containing protein [Candidatus Lokiarchaeia archaeon]
MIGDEYPLDSLKLPYLALFKHLFCMDGDLVQATDLDVIIEHYCSPDDPGTKAVLEMLGVRQDDDVWSFVEKNIMKKRLLQEFTQKFAFVNGREDVGNSFSRYKEELANKGIEHDDFWMDQISIAKSGLTGFPVGSPYHTVILANPEPLESDSAPMFLLKSAIIEELERSYRVFPTRQADITARSKLETLRVFASKGISTPATLVTASIHEGLQFVKDLHEQGMDVVIKPVTKGGGWGVSKIPAGIPDSQIMDILGKYKWWYGDGVLLLQEFIQNEKHDKRVLIIDGLIIGVERRMATLDTESWIYNISKGATGSRDVLDAEERQLVLDAFNATSQFFAGVDLIKGLDGQNYILEVNSTPGFKGFEQFVGFNVASFVLDYLIFFQ